MRPNDDFLAFGGEPALPVQMPFRFGLAPWVALRDNMRPVPPQHLSALGPYVPSAPGTYAKR